MHKIENENLINIVTDARDSVDGAFEKLYKETIKFSYGIACSILKNEEDIEDALQNSYMYVAKSIKNLKNPESFEGWLSTIVRHECQKYIAKRKRISDVFASVLSSKKHELLSSETVPYELIEKRTVYEAVRRMVDSLPEDKRACIVLYYFEQISLPEIAQILGIPEGTVKSRLYSARKILEKEFKKLQKKDGTLYGISVIPLVAAFFTYQLKNISVPVSIAEGASACLVAESAAATVASTASVSAGSGGSVTGAFGAAGSAGATATTKVVAVVVAATVATSGGVAAVNYVENKKEAESTTFMQSVLTEEHTTALAVTDETTTLISETVTEIESAEATTNKHTTNIAATVAPTKVGEKATKTTTARNETTAMVTEKESVQPTTTEIYTTQKTPITEVPTTDAANVYSVSGGILSEYAGAEGNVSVPSSVDGDSVTAIGTGAFSGNTDVISVSLPSTVTKIGQEAFSDCTSLVRISLPSSLQSIGIGAFWGCTKLENVSIPSGVTQIGDDAFADCLSLKSVVIPSTVTSIGDNAFGGCNNLTIKCAEGSAAHNYAVENSIEFELI